MKKASILSIFAATVILAAPVCFAIETSKEVTMAVFNFKANGVSDSLARSVTELFLVNLAESDAVRIVERSDIEKILHEHELMLSGYTEESDAIEAGRLLSAHKVLIGSVILL